MERSDPQSVTRWLMSQIVALLLLFSVSKGPSHWGEQYNSCAGKHQSPININSLDVKKVNLPPLALVGFDVAPRETNLTNNGHTGKFVVFFSWGAGYRRLRESTGHHLGQRMLSPWTSLKA